MIGKTNVGGGGAAAPTLQEISVTASGVYTPSAGYDGISKVTASFDESAELIALRKLIDGTATVLSIPSGITKVKPYLCWQSSQSSTLRTITIGGQCVEIGQRAFYNNTYAVITPEIEDDVRYYPRWVKTFGDYSHYYTGYNVRSTAANKYVLHPSSKATVGQYAFQYSAVKEVRGAYASIGTYAFNSCLVTDVDLSCDASIGSYAFQSNSALANVVLDCKGVGQYALAVTATTFKKLHIRVGGTIDSYAFDGAQYVEDFNLDPASVVSNLNAYAFRGFGARRTNGATFTMDFRASSFKTVGQCAFYPTSTSYPLKDMHIYLPSGLTTVSAQAFQYLKDSVIHFTGAAPAVSNTNAFANLSNTWIAVPFARINEYRTKTNLTAYTAIIRGEVTGRASLPELNSEGYELTWYHDVACTDPVTSSDVIDETATYYCTAGTQKVAYAISWTQLNCTVAPTDGVTMYGNGDGVRVGTVLTINVTGAQGTPLPYMLQLNGVDIASGDTYTIADEDVAIKAIYWDGENVPVSPNLADNSLDLLQLGGDSGLASMWNIGDIWIDPLGQQWRLVDHKSGRYNRVDNGKTHIVLEKIPLYSQNTMWYTSSYSENYGQSLLHTKMSAGGAYSNLEDPDVAAWVDSHKVIVKASQASSSTPVDVQVGFFDPCYTEMGFTGTYGYASAAETESDGVQFGAFEYYEGAANSKRIKYPPGVSSGYYYRWLRSRYGSGYAVIVNYDGSRGTSYVNTICGACPCIAL